MAACENSHSCYYKYSEKYQREKIPLSEALKE